MSAPEATAGAPSGEARHCTVIDVAASFRPVPDDPGTLLKLASGEFSLTLTAHPHRGKGKEERWYDVNVEADAHHFSGSVRDFMTEDDLRQWRVSAATLIEQMGSGASGGDVTLRGHQLPLFTMSIQHQEDITSGWIVEIHLAPNSDDPYPYLRFRMEDIEPFLPNLVAALDRLMKIAAE